MTAETSTTGSIVRRKRPTVSCEKRSVAQKLTAISQKEITTRPQTTAMILRGIVTANTTVMMSFLTISSRTINGPLLLIFNTL